MAASTQASRSHRANAIGRFATSVQDACDARWAEYYSSALAILLFNMAAFTFSRGYKLASGWDGWTVGEWLVTYSNGFVRRGIGVPSGLGIWLGGL